MSWGGSTSTPIHHDLDDPSEEYAVGPYRLRVVAKEAVLVGRVVEYDQTGHTGYAAQAILMLRVFRGRLDRELLATLVRRERVEGAFTILRDLADRPAEQVVTDDELRMARDRLRGYVAADDTARPPRGEDPERGTA